MKSLKPLINAHSAPELERMVAEWSDNAICGAPWIFDLWGHEHQIPKWYNYQTWLIIGGRGAGKTRAGAEWVRNLIEGETPKDLGEYRRVAIIGQSFDETREVMIFGPSGIIQSCPENNRPKWCATRRALTWPNGAEALVFSAHQPEALRGPQFDAAWLDEFAKWPNAEAVWDMLQFCLRLNENAKSLITTTPRRKAILHEIMAMPNSITSHARSGDNAIGLPKSFLRNIEARYAGTWLGRQEIEGELVGECDGALWQRDMFQYCDEDLLQFDRIVIAIDPSVSSGENSDATGIVAVAACYPDSDPRTWKAYVLADGTAQFASPEEWASRAMDLYEIYNADMLVAEVNQGGEMVEAMLRNINPFVNFRPKHARDSKFRRAEAIAALYRQGRVFHCRGLGELEAQMNMMTAEGYQGKGSPDRLDACVWALQVLMLDALKSQRPHQLRQL